VTVLTGASSGWGRALAPRLASDGHAVALLARRAEPLEALAARIRDGGGEALAIACDVSDRAAVQDAVRRARAALGPIERLVANAGISEPTPGRRFDAAAFERIQRTNLIGPAYCIEAVLPEMIERRSGHLVGVSSLAAYRGLPTWGGYCASKAGLSALLESLRVELGPYGVAVTTIHPGFVKTPMTEKGGSPMPFLLELEDAADRMHRAIRARRRLFAFPWPLAAASRVGRLLPAAIYDAGLRRAAK
jgi:NAD(P)-dependent dehydrogenase (short-subunit alcohol dehydrogenase family)